MSFIVSYEKMCCCEGGFGGNVEHDPHILYTLSAVQVLALFDKLNVIDVDKVTSCILTHIFCAAEEALLFLQFFTYYSSVLLSGYVTSVGYHSLML